MLFFSVILLSLVQFAFLAYDPNDPCVYGLNYCLNSDGSTKCAGNSVVYGSYGAHHDDSEEWLSVSLLAQNTDATNPVTISIGFTVDGKPYNLYCSSDDDKHVNGHTSAWDNFDFSCNFRLSLTGSNKQNPVTNKSISIDLATIEDNVPVTLGFNGVQGVVAPNLKESLFYQLKYLDCWEENRMSFMDNNKKNRVMLLKKVYNKEMQTFVYGLSPDTKSTDRSVKFSNADGASLTVSCNNSFGTLTGFVQKGDKKESIDNLFTFKSLDGYRCGFKLPLIVQTKNIEFDFDARPLDFSFSSTSGSSISKSNIKFDTDERNWPDLSSIQWSTYNSGGK